MSNQESSVVELDSAVSFELDGELLEADTPAELLQQINKKLGRQFKIELSTRAIIEKVDTIRGQVEEILGYCKLIQS